MEADPKRPLPPYQPVPNVPPPPAPQAPGSNFGTVTPGAQPYDSQSGGFGASQPGEFPPPQEKSRTGLIIGLIVGTVVLIGAVFMVIGIVLFRSIDLEEFEGINGTASLEDTVRFDPFDGNEVTANGQISSGAYDAFEIEFEAGSEIVISAIATDSFLDTVLTVRDASGQQVARNDDHNGASLPSNLDSQVVFVPGSTETYTIEVSDFGNFDSGGYELIISAAG